MNLFSLALFVACGILLIGCGERPPIDSKQLGYRGVGMEQNINPRMAAKAFAANQAPESLPAVDAGGPRAAEVYQNVQVLGDLSVAEFARVMAAITTWVSPNEGCTYCHKGDNLAIDDVYTKVVARKMLQMNRAINTQWKAHVGETGVTCYTCHRGQHIPRNVWYEEPKRYLSPFIAGNAGQNVAGRAVASASLPTDPFTPFLNRAENIRVISTSTFQQDNPANIKNAEWTYSLMNHMSQSLGVNCTFCHNSRSFSKWEQSTPQRVTAWHGIRMTRDANVNYIVPLTSEFPASRKGPNGDVAKVFCGTCHNGQNKPLNGVSMYKDYPELGAPRPPPAPATDAPAPEGAAAAPPTAAAGAPAP
jgi:photosynthetic reaction center cytochrome c subunit